MTDSANVACLLYCLPHDLNTTRKFTLRSTVTCLGRLTPQQVQPADAGHLQLDLPTVSVQHARIARTAAGYVLQNWQGRYGIGLYERALQPGQSHPLTHGDVFRIPARATHVRLQFLAAHDQTLVRPLDIEPARGQVYVFGEPLRLTPLEYRLIAHLSRHAGDLCPYNDLMTALWGDTNPFERKGNLEVLLHDLRAKLRMASGGFTFLETVWGQGVRLVV